MTDLLLIIIGALCGAVVAELSWRVGWGPETWQFWIVSAPGMFVLGALVGDLRRRWPN